MFDGFVFVGVDLRLFVGVLIYYNCMGCLSVCVYGVCMIVRSRLGLPFSAAIDEAAR